MNDAAPYKLYRGRPLRDPAWSALVANSPHIIDNDEREDSALLGAGLMPRGCIKFFKEEKYYCNFYLGGAQRHIAKGTLYQCAKFYDYALIFFNKYRVRKAVTNFNFDRADDESEMALAPGISDYLAKLEKHLVDSGELALPVDKSETRKEKRYKRTIAGSIDTFREELQPYIFDIADSQDAAMKILSGIESRLSVIEAHLKITEKTV